MIISSAALQPNHLPAYLRTVPGALLRIASRPKLWAAVLVVSVCASAQANLIEFTGTLSSAGETPPTSPGTGSADVWLDTIANTLRVIVNFSGLTSPTIASHIHAATVAPFTGNAGVATTVPTFPGFPLGVTSGTYDQTFDLGVATSYNPAFVTAHGGTVPRAETALINALQAGESYLNIHTQEHPGGEIRTFLTQVPDHAATAP